MALKWNITFALVSLWSVLDNPHADGRYLRVVRADLADEVKFTEEWMKAPGWHVFSHTENPLMEG